MDLQLSQPLTSAKKLVHGLVGTDLQEDVDVLRILKEMLKTYYMRMMQRPVNLNLSHKLLLRPRLREGGLGHDFSGQQLARFKRGQLVASRKAALAEESALGIAPQGDLPAHFYDLLLDYGAAVGFVASAGWFAHLLFEWVV